MAAGLVSPRAWLLFVLSSVIWGIPYLFIKVALDGGVPPGLLAWARVALGAACILPLALRRRAFRGLRARTVPIVAYAACEIAVPFVLIAAGERYIASSLTAILIATMPLFVALLATRLSTSDRPTGARLVGLVLGFGGVVALLGIDVAGRPHQLLGAALVLGGTICYAVAPLIVDRSLSDLDPLGPMAASLVGSTVALLPAALVRLPDALPSVAGLVALVVLGLVCTALGLVVFFQLIAAAGPTRASVITYINPLVAVLAGTVFLDEQIGTTGIAGMALILLGSWLSSRRESPHPATMQEGS